MMVQLIKISGIHSFVFGNLIIFQVTFEIGIPEKIIKAITSPIKMKYRKIM